MFSQGNSKKKGIEVTKNLYAFGEDQMLDCNIYCLASEETNELALFDLGNGLSLRGLFEGMKDLNLDYKNITKVFLTHEHVDHVLGIYPLMQMLKENPPEIFAYGETAKILEEGDQSQIFPGNLGISPRMFGVEIIPHEITDIKELKEFQVFSEYNFQIFYTPGHSLGSVSYYEPTKQILIPGDVVFCGGSFGRYDFPGGSLKTLQNSVKFLNDLNVKYLLPGHMGITDMGNEHVERSFRMIQSIGDYF